MVEDGVADEIDSASPSLHPFQLYIAQFELTTNTMAFAGSHEVDWDGGKVRYADWTMLSQYRSEFIKQGWKRADKFTWASIVEYLTQVEEQYRARAIELARSGTPWGHSLIAALKEDRQPWDDHKDVLQTSRPPAPPPSLCWNCSNPVGKGKVAKVIGKGNSPGAKVQKTQGQKTQTQANTPASGSEGWRKWPTSRFDRNQKEICIMFNDSRTCSNPCPNKRLHVCNVKLSSGQVCGSTSHCRRTHVPSQHGQPAGK